MEQTNYSLKDAIQGTLAINQIGELVLHYKRRVLRRDQPIIKSSKDCYDIFMSSWDYGKLNLCEQFKVCLLAASGKVLGICELSTGGPTGTIVNVPFVIGVAILGNASSILIAHNHPSGSLNPSKSDQAMTQKIKAAAALFDITLHDHIIVTDSGYLSFAEEGLL